MVSYGEFSRSKPTARNHFAVRDISPEAKLSRKVANDKNLVSRYKAASRADFALTSAPWPFCAVFFRHPSSCAPTRKVKNREIAEKSVARQRVRMM